MGQSGVFNVLLMTIFWKCVRIEAAPVLIDRRLSGVSEDSKKTRLGWPRALEGSQRHPAITTASARPRTQELDESEVLC